MKLQEKIKFIQPIFSKIVDFFAVHRAIIVAITIGLILILILIIILYLFIKKPLGNTIVRFADYMFSPSPKSVGFLGNRISSFLSDKDKAILLQLFNKLQANHMLSIMINGNNILTTLESYKIDETQDIGTFLMGNNAIIVLKNTNLVILDKILQQLKSYSPVPSWIITILQEGEEISITSMLQKELGIVVKKNFSSPPNFSLVYHLKEREEFKNQPSIVMADNYPLDYSFLIEEFPQGEIKQGFSLLARSLIHGLALEIQGNSRKILEDSLQQGTESPDNINSIFLLVNDSNKSLQWEKFNNFIYENRHNKAVAFVDNPKIRFWQKIYKTFLILAIIYFCYHLLISHLEYQKLIQLIKNGNQILFNQSKEAVGVKNTSEEEQLKIARDFVAAVMKINLFHIKTRGQEEVLLSLGEYFAKVYRSSIFHIYKRKINSLTEEMDNNTEILVKKDSKTPDYSIKILKDVTGIIHWKVLMEKIQQLDFLLSELKQMFSYDNQDSLGISHVEKKINNLVNCKKLPHQGESKEIKILVQKSLTKIQDNIITILDIMLGSLMNKNLLRKKQDLHRVLAAITVDYVDKKQTVNFATIEYLFKEIQEFSAMINTDFYGFLDENQFFFPKEIEEDINQLIKKGYLDQYLRERMIKDNTAKLQNYKSLLFNLDHTFLSPTDKKGSRSDFLNSGDTNLNIIYEALQSILSDEFVQILQNSVPDRYNPITQGNIDNSSIIWDLKKIEAIDKIVEVYSTFYEKWNSMNNNMFLFVLNKLLNNNFIKLLKWTMDQAVIMEKLEKANINTQQENLKESMVFFNSMIKNNSNILYYAPIIKKVVFQQMKTIAKLLLDSFNSLWFANIHPENWNGKEPILKAVVGVSDCNLLNKVFIKDFSLLDNTLTSAIIPYIDIVLQQKILTEQELPYEITLVGDIMGQISLYKNQEDNDIKKLEQQLMDYDKMQAYDLFKLESRKCASSGNIFINISDNLHNVLVKKAKTTVRIEKIGEYNKIVNFFNNKCSNKVPFVCTSLESVSLEDLNTLKNMLSNVDQIVYILQQEGEKNPNSIVTKALNFLAFLKEFFAIVEVGNNYSRVKFTMELQYNEEGTANDDVIMRWHTYFGEKESHNNKILENINIGYRDRFQIVMDIAKDSSIEVIEYKKIVPLERGCLIFSENHWGLWRFIGNYYFKENNDSIILAIKIPIIVSETPLAQEWIITYIKVTKLPFFAGKADNYK